MEAIILPSYLPGLLCGSNEREFFVKMNELYSLEGLLIYTQTLAHALVCVYVCIHKYICVNIYTHIYILYIIYI